MVLHCATALHCISFGIPRNPFIDFVTHKFPAIDNIGDALIPEKTNEGEREATREAAEESDKNCKCKVAK